MAYNVPLQFITYKSPQINMKNLQTTTLFTTGSFGNFYIVQIISIGDNIVNPIGNAFNMGFTNPNYDDVVNGSNFVVFTTNNYATIILVAPALVIPPSTDIKIKVTTAETGTTFLGHFLIMGIYI